MSVHLCRMVCSPIVAEINHGRGLLRCVAAKVDFTLCPCSQFKLLDRQSGSFRGIPQSTVVLQHHGIPQQKKILRRGVKFYQSRKMLLTDLLTRCLDVGMLL